MLMRLVPGAAALASEHGLIRAADLEAVRDVAAAVRHWQAGADERRLRQDAECQAVLEDARQQAALLLEQARAEIDAWQAQARERLQAEAEDARLKGYEEGHAQALADWHGQQVDRARSLQADVRAVQSPLARVVCDAVAAIVRTADPEALYQRALAEVQASCRGATRLRLHVSPADEAAAGRALAGWAAGDIEVETVVHIDMAAGSCVAETDAGWVDASLDLQLAALRDAMDRAEAGFAREVQGAPADE